MHTELTVDCKSWESESATNTFPTNPQNDAQAKIQSDVALLLKNDGLFGTPISGLFSPTETIARAPQLPYFRRYTLNPNSN